MALTRPWATWPLPGLSPPAQSLVVSAALAASPDGVAPGLPDGNAEFARARHPRGEQQFLAARHVRPQEAQGIGAEAHLVGTDDRCVAARLQDRRHRCGGAGDRPQDAGGGEIDHFDAGRQDVIGVDVALVETEPRDEFRHQICIAAELHPACMLDVGRHFRAVPLQAPAVEHLGQSLASFARRRDHAHAAAFRDGIEEHEHLAAFQGVLIDGVGRLFGEILGLGHHQDIETGRNVLHVLRDHAHLEQIADLAHDQPRPLRPDALRHVGFCPFQRQSAHDADNTLSRVGERRDEFGHVVFEEGFTVGGEEGNGLLGIGRIGRHQSEVADLAFGVEPHAPQTRRDRAILGVRKRFGIEDRQFQLAARPYRGTARTAPAPAGNSAIVRAPLRQAGVNSRDAR